MNTALKFYLNDDSEHEFANLKVYHGNTPVLLRCSTDRFIPFCHNFDTLGTTIDKIKIQYYEDGSELTLDAASEALFEYVTDGDYDWILYKGEAVDVVAGAITGGLVRLIIELTDGNDFYSDYFEICLLDETCESNSQLLGNPDFDNWLGDDPVDWDVSAEDVNNYITFWAAGVAQIITADGGELEISQDDIMTIGSLYEIEVVLSAWTSGNLTAQGVMYSPTMGSAATFTFYTIATSTTFGLAANKAGATALKITSCEVTEIERCVIDDYFNIFFHAYGDLADPSRILYQTGYENRHAFDALPIKPDAQLNIEGEADEAMNESIFSIANQKTYMVEFFGGESLFDMLSILRFHEYIHISWPGQDLSQAHNVEFQYEWVDDYLCHIILKFSFDNLQKGGCPTNFTLT